MRVYGGGDYPAYVIDPDTLREELLSEEDTREWLAEVPDDPQAVTFWRMLGELDTARDVGELALADREPGTPAWAAAALRLAHVHHWRGEHEQAHELMDDAEEVFRHADQGEGSTGAMLAFVDQHRAKTCFDEGRYALARDLARRALAARERLGAPAGVVASSRETLERIERALDESGGT